MHAARFSASAALTSASFASAVVLFAWLWSDYREYWLDDAFITFRYSRHLAEGLGPVYNLGEHVEGYTSFLWMLLAGLPLHFAAESAALASIKAFSLIASFWVLYRVWSFPGPDGPTRRWWVLILASQPVFIINCGDGMETPLFLVLMVECVLALQREPSGRGGTGVGLLTALMILTRPESLALLIAIPLLVGFAHRHDRERREDVLAWFRAFLLAALLPVICHEAWRWSYYGQPFPNTYYAKATGSQLARLGGGVEDISRFLSSNPWRAPVAIWIAIVLGVLVSAKRMARVQPGVVRWLGALWLMVAFRLCFDLWSGSDTMGRHRFLAPLLVPLIILADEGARFLWRGAGRGVVVALLVISLYYNVTGHWNHEGSAGHYRRGLENAHIALGRWLHEQYPADSVLAIGDAGAIPFFSRLTTIDLWGLNDAVIAHLPGEYGYKKAMVEDVLGRDPDVIVLWNRVSFLAEDTPDETLGDDHRVGRVYGGKEIDRSIAEHPSFAHGYRFVREFVFRVQSLKIPGYYLDVFERR
jgi:arabinofuranosyltransferase